MRIISKFTDVYDLQNSLFDPKAVWNRTTDTVKVRYNKDVRLVFSGDIPSSVDTYRGGRFFFHVQLVFIAGEVYPLYTIKNGGEKTPHYVFNPGSVSRYDFETFDPVKFADQVIKLGGGAIRFNGEWELRAETPHKTMEKFVTRFENEWKVPAINLLKELEQPLVMVNKYGNGLLSEDDKQEVAYWDITTNFCFNDLRIPWQEIQPNLYILHQLIEQYKFGVLGNKEPEVTRTSDKDRLEAHGFSNKYSFRNMGRN